MELATLLMQRPTPSAGEASDNQGTVRKLVGELQVQTRESSRRKYEHEKWNANKTTNQNQW
jgi:hypothetical protein